MQNLIHSVWMSGKDARILGLASRRVPGTLRTSGLQLPFLAHAQWGARALYYATFLSAVGEPLRTGRGPQTAQILAAQFRIRAVRIRTISPPQCTCAWGALAGRDAGALHVLTPFEAQDTVWNILAQATRSGQRIGIELHWATETLKPGGAPGGAGLGAGGFLHHVLECHGTSATHTLADLQNSLNGLRSGGAPVSVWRDDDLRDAVFISLRSGCCPAALMSLHEITRHMGGAVGVASDGVLLFGVLPALVEAYISRSGVLNWSRHVAPPVRLLASAVLSGPSNDMSFRLASPAAGHELLWLVATRGQLSNACVERAVFELTGHPTCATTVEALHPELGTYQPMAMLRGDPAATMALQNLTAGPGLCIGGATCRVFPITHIRQDAHRAPGGDMAAARLREAAALPGVADAARTTTFSVVAQRSQADEVGRSIGPPSAGTMDLARGQRVLGTSDLCVTTVHVFLRSELTVCTWTVEDPCPGACPPSLDVTTLDSERALLATRSPLASFPREVPSRAGLTEWNGQLLPGEYILAEVAAGGVIDLSGPGELISIRLTQPAWVRILHPLDAGRRAVEAGCSEALTVKLQQITYNTREARIAGLQPPVRAQPPVNGAEAPAPSVARPRGLLGWLASAAVLPPPA